MNELRNLRVEANILAYELLQNNDKDKLKRLRENMLVTDKRIKTIKKPIILFFIFVSLRF